MTCKPLLVGLQVGSNIIHAPLDKVAAAWWAFAKREQWDELNTASR